MALLFLSKTVRAQDQRAQLMNEARPLLEQAGDPLYQAEYWMDMGSFLSDQNQIDQAADAFAQSMALREETQDTDGIGMAAMSLGDIALFRRDYDECLRQYERSLTCFQRSKNKTMESFLLSRLGNIDLLTGNFSGAADHFKAGIALNQQTGDRFGMVNSLYDLGRLDLNIGECRRAGQRFAEVSRLGTEIDLPQAVLAGLLFQGLAALDMGDPELAASFTQQAIDFWRAAPPGAFNPGFIAGNLDNLAVLLASRRADLAARLFAAIDQSGLIQRELNTPFELAVYENARAAVRQSLGEEGFAAAQGLTLEEALALALQQD